MYGFFPPPLVNSVEKVLKRLKHCVGNSSFKANSEVTLCFVATVLNYLQLKPYFPSSVNTKYPDMTKENRILEMFIMLLEKSEFSYWRKHLDP